MKNEKGVTITALAITIIVLLIVLSISVYSGMSTLSYAKYNKAKSEITTVQTNVNDWYDEYNSINYKVKDDPEYTSLSTDTQRTNYINNKKTQFIQAHGAAVNSADLQQTISAAGITVTNTSNFRFLTTDYLKDNLGLNSSYEYFIDIPTRTILLYKGITYNEKTYYTAEDFGIYNVENNEISTVNFNVAQGLGKHIVISNVVFKDTKAENVNISKFNVSYKKSSDSENGWMDITDRLIIDKKTNAGTTTIKYKFLVSEYGTYDVKISSTDYRVQNTQKNVNVAFFENAPKLAGGMIPIKYNESSGKWAITNEDDEEWYSYTTTNRKWANVMLSDGKYKASKPEDYTTDGTTEIELKDIGSMFVWIPRYAYKITSNLYNGGSGVSGNIEIKFLQDKSNKDKDGNTISTTYPSVTGSGTSTAMTNFVVHPAFGTNVDNGGWDADITGIWVAKYAAGFQANTTSPTDATTKVNENDKVEYSNSKYTSYNSSSTTNALQQDLSAANYQYQRLSYPVFKPLTYAYNLISLSDRFTISREIQNASFYGLNNADSHLTKNSEWGAIVYLTQSAYGRNGVEVTVNSKNVNNSSKRVYAITGYAGTTANGVNASSTGNMYGIFDLSGCVWEIVSAFISNSNANLLSYGKSLLDEADVSYSGPIITAKTGKSNKYVTIYPYPNTDTMAGNYNEFKNYKTTRFGDAILEISNSGTSANSWFQDRSDFIATTQMTFTRGAAYRIWK